MTQLKSGTLLQGIEIAHMPAVIMGVCYMPCSSLAVIPLFYTAVQMAG